MSTEITTTTEPANQTKRKAKAAKKTKAAKTGKAGKSTKAAKVPSTKAKSDTKKAIVLELLRRKEGATMADLAKATDWQNHSIRGFISGTITKKMGLVVESAKSEGGERTYRIAQ